MNDDTFLTRAFLHDDACAQATLQELPNMGEQAPRCYALLDRTLEGLQRYACCSWGCPGGNDPHVLQRLATRVVSNAVAAVGLMLAGHYDEALGLARNIGENANLLMLFRAEPASAKEWYAALPKKRWQMFRPAVVRKRLTALGSPLALDDDEYSHLSTPAHVEPSTHPNLLGATSSGTSGAVFDPKGFIIALNELSWCVAVFTGALAGIGGLSQDHFKVLSDSATQLLGFVGSVRLAASSKTNASS